MMNPTKPIAQRGKEKADDALEKINDQIEVMENILKAVQNNNRGAVNRLPAEIEEEPPTPFRTSHEAASWIIRQLPKECHPDYDPLDALWLAFQGLYSPTYAADKLRGYGVIVSNN